MNAIVLPPDPQHDHKHDFKQPGISVEIFRVTISLLGGALIGSLFGKYIFNSYEVGLVLSCLVNAAIWEFLRDLNKTSV